MKYNQNLMLLWIVSSYYIICCYKTYFYLKVKQHRSPRTTHTSDIQNSTIEIYNTNMNVHYKNNNNLDRQNNSIET